VPQDIPIAQRAFRPPRAVGHLKRLCGTPCAEEAELLFGISVLHEGRGHERQLVLPRDPCC
jgi:hypothetical protein